MKIDISIVREISIPLGTYPYIEKGESLSKGIDLLTGNRSETGCRIHFDSLLVVNEAGEYIGQFELRSILKNFFGPAIEPLASHFPLKDRDSYADTIVAIDDWFKSECQRKSTTTIGEYLSVPQTLPSVTPSCHVLEALDHLLRTESSVLPVIENNVLLGAVRLEDVFTALAAGFQPEFNANYTFTTEG
ncbi:CBS domain-containing protein [Desulfosediminicola sp.]|uniref:CBS domain-containing protein n=1 Tax=Desulfosediminicola sp. TaxID=2886825 RepID=UPI003AF2BC08